jgi:hypothetical protein
MEDVNTGSKEIDEIDEALKEFATQRRKGPLATMASSSEKIQQYPTLQGLRSTSLKKRLQRKLNDATMNSYGSSSDERAIADT